MSDVHQPKSARKHLFVVALALSALVLLSLAGLWLYSQYQRSNYEEGQQAQAHHDWDSALSHFQSASGYKDADRLASNAATHVTQRNTAYYTAVSILGPVAVTSSSTQTVVPRVLITGESVLTALQAINTVQTIEPHYQWVDALAATAQDEAYTDALSGTVVMRTQASPPGLYYRGASGWEWLRGSDQDTRVLSVRCPGRIIYSSAQTGALRPNSTSVPNLVSETRSRSILPQSNPAVRWGITVAAIQPGPRDGASSDLQYSSLAMDPADYDYMVCSGTGVWGASGLGYVDTGDVPGSNAAPLWQYISDSTTTLSYEAWDSQSINYLSLPDPQAGVADLGQTSGSVLMVSNAASQDADTNSEIARLYLTGPQGDNPRLVYTTTGTINSAQLSPDERYAIIVVSKPKNNGSGSTGQSSKMSVQALLFDLTKSEGGPTPSNQFISPVVLVQTTTDVGTENNVQPYGSTTPDYSSYLNFSVTATFLNKGEFRNKLVLAWLDDKALDLNTCKLRIVDPALPRVNMLDMSIPRGTHTMVDAQEQEDGSTLLVYDKSLSLLHTTGNPMTSAVTVIKASGSSSSSSSSSAMVAGSVAVTLAAAGNSGDVGASLALSATTYNIYLSEHYTAEQIPELLGATLRNGSLIYSTYANWISNESLAIFTLPLRGLKPGAPATKPGTLYSATWQSDSKVPDIYWYMGPQLFTYADTASGSPGPLRVRPFSVPGATDGGSSLNDITLEEDIAAIYSLSNSYLAHALH